MTDGGAHAAGQPQVMRRIVALYPIALFILLWEAVAQAGIVRPVFLPPFSTVIARFVSLVVNGEMVNPLLTSLYRAFSGLAIATVVGVAAGILMTRSRWLRWLLEPLISIGFPSPKITFVPIFVLWFGIDHLSKILLVAFACVFPMIVSAYHGAQSVTRTWIWSAQAMGTSDRVLMRRIVLPAALPDLFSGLRVALPVALITAYTAEMVAGGGGLGAALIFSQRFFETVNVFAYIVAMLVSGMFLDFCLLRIRHRVVGWHEER